MAASEVVGFPGPTCGANTPRAREGDTFRARNFPGEKASCDDGREVDAIVGVADCREYPPAEDRLESSRTRIKYRLWDRCLYGASVTR